MDSKTITSPKLTFSSQLMRVRLEFTPSQIKSLSKKDVGTFVEKSKKKMQSLLDKGEIIAFYTHEDRLNRLVNILGERHVSEENISRPLKMTLAYGVMKLEGISVTPATEDGLACKISIENETSLKEAKGLHLFYYISHCLKKEGSKKIVSAAAAENALLLFQSGSKITDHELADIEWMKAFDPFDIEIKTPFLFTTLGQKTGVALKIYDPLWIFTKSKRTELISLIVAESSKRLNGVKYTILKEEIKETFQLIQNGVERFGFALPMDFLVAQKKTEKTKKAKPKAVNYPGKGILKLSISPNKMVASIGNFNLEWYNNPKYEINQSWLEQECERLGVRPDSKCITDILKTFRQKADPNGQAVAMGKFAENGTNPKLISYEVKGASSKVDVDSDELVDFREPAKKSMTDPGQLIAEIVCEDVEQKGQDVFGKPSNVLKDPPDLKIKIGGGIEEKEPGKYYATIIGIPEIDDKSVAVNPVYIHKGDVNLTSGNIDFEGKVVITGNVEKGSKVKAKEDIVIEGAISGGEVKTLGSLKVKNGIIGATVKCETDLEAEFVEHSKVSVKGNTKIKRAILNSTYVGGGEIRIKEKSGVVAGGTVGCVEQMIVGTLGFPSNNPTEITMGVDLETALAIQNLQSRFDNFIQALEEEEKQLEQLTTTEEPVPDKKKHIKASEKKIKRLTKITKRIKFLKKMKKKSIEFNEDSTIKILNTLYPSCKIDMGNTEIELSPNPVSSVVVKGKPTQGKYIVSLRPSGNEEKVKGDDSPDSPSSPDGKAS